MDWAVALAAAGQAVSIAKDLREIGKGLGEAETKLKLAELYTNLGDVKMALVDAQTEMREKDREIDDLRKSFELRATLVERGDFKFFAGPDGRAKGMAICPRCETVDGRIIRVVRVLGGHTNCPECKRVYVERDTSA